MWIISRPMLSATQDARETDILVSEIAAELWRLYGRNGQIDWIGVERHLQRIARDARVRSALSSASERRSSDAPGRRRRRFVDRGVAAVRPGSMGADRIVLDVSGLKDNRSREQVADALARVRGVRDAQVSLVRGRATVWAEPPCDAAELIRAVERAGFAASASGERGPVGGLQTDGSGGRRKAPCRS